MMWTLAKACLVIAAVIALIWLLQTFGMVALIDDPAAGFVFFGLVGIALTYLVQSHARKVRRNGIRRL